MAENAPLFRVESAQLRPLAPVPQAIQTVAGPAVALPAIPSAVVRAPRVRREVRDVPAFVRRQRLRGLAGLEPAETFTIRTPDGAAVLAELSLGLQVQVQAGDNVNAAPPPLAIADTVLDFTPIIRLTAGGSPRMQSEDSREPEFYLDALYAPTEHRLVRERESGFLNHLLVQAGRSTAVAQTGVRLLYDDNVFAAGSESTPEESFTVFEVGPIVAYRTSVRTTVHFRASFRRITEEQATGNRRESDLEAGIEYEISPKTIVGTGLGAGHIRFDEESFGTQDYRQGYGSIAWKPTRTLAFRTRMGVEWREFQRQDPPPTKWSLVGSAALEWEATATTRLAALLAITNQPSVVQSGTLFHEVRYGLQVEQDLGEHYYAACEVECQEREYDTGRHETDFTLRPALGYRILSGAVCDSIRLEVFYLFRRHWNHGAGGDYTRNQGGVQLSLLY